MIWTRIAEYLRLYLGMFLNRKVILVSLLILTSVYFAATAGILLFERNSAGGLRQPSDVLWWVTLTLLSITDPGFFPTTTGGKLVGLFLTTFSTVLLWLFSAIVVTVVLDIVLKEGQGMGSTKHKNHIIICGWNETAEEIIEQLHSADPERREVLRPDEGSVHGRAEKEGGRDRPGERRGRGDQVRHLGGRRRLCVEAILRCAHEEEREHAVHAAI